MDIPGGLPGRPGSLRIRSRSDAHPFEISCAGNFFFCAGNRELFLSEFLIFMNARQQMEARQNSLPAIISRINPEFMGEMYNLYLKTTKNAKDTKRDTSSTYYRSRGKNFRIFTRGQIPVANCFLLPTGIGTNFIHKKKMIPFGV